MVEAKGKRKTIQWQISVPIFRNRLILGQLAIAIGIPFGLLILFIVLSWDPDKGSGYALWAIVILFFLTWVLIQAVYGGMYEAEFFLNDRGILCRTQSGQRKINRVMNTLTVVLGLFSRKPAVAGAGLLAQSRQEVFLNWRQIQKVSFDAQRRTVLLRGGWLESLALFCTEDNYDQVREMIMEKVGIQIEM